MSLNFLKFGLNINKTVMKEERMEIIVNPFPNCIEEKKNILLLNKKIKKLRTTNELEKLKEKKLQIYINQLEELEEALNDKLMLNSNIKINPLCSFEEIQKYVVILN